jgi:glycosyltransferase involved in cell wall biosynthesis
MKKILSAKAVVLAPVYSPYPAGGAQSFPIVAASLAKLFDSVLVITEYHPSIPCISKENQVDILRILPVRDNRGSKSHLYSIASYFLTQALILFLLPILRVQGFEVLHYTRYSSFCLSILVWIWRATGGFVVYDCRTMAFNSRSKRALKSSLSSANAALANSESALQSILTLSSVPVASYIVNPLYLPAKDAVPSLCSFPSLSHLANQTFILCLGTLSLRKNSHLVHQAFESLLSGQNTLPGPANSCRTVDYSRLKLVYAGRSDLPAGTLTKLLSSPFVEYLGPISHLESLAITSAAALSINISNAEGIPRSMLEALYFGVPCILPSCVPEFLRYLPELCFDVPDAGLSNTCELAHLIASFLQDPDRVVNIISRYPIESHFIESYHELLYKKIYRNFYVP